MKNAEFQHKTVLGGNALVFWRTLQWLVWLVGLAIFLALVFFPQTGILLFWNILIPVAPALFVLATGIWRNICPLATVSMLPHHLKISRKKRAIQQQQGQFALIGTLLLFTIVPLRHLSLNFDASATALTIVFLSALAFVSGYLYDAKSGWCSGMCPVHPVERLYGQKVFFSPANAHCGKCHNCVSPCPDSTPDMHPQLANKRPGQQLAGMLITGGLPGFIIGWFHVPDYKQSIHLPEIMYALLLPWGGLAISLAVYCAACRWAADRYKIHIINLFAAASVSAYYWYRLPALVGYGLFPGEGMLVDLTNVLPIYGVQFFQISVTAFFFWWLMVRQQAPAVWAYRPPFLKH